MCRYPTRSASRTALEISPVPFLNLYVPRPMIGMSIVVSSINGPAVVDGELEEDPSSSLDDTARNVRSDSAGIWRAADSDAMDDAATSIEDIPTDDNRRRM